MDNSFFSPTTLLGNVVGIQDQNGTTFGATSFGIQINTFAGHTSVNFYNSSTGNSWVFTGNVLFGDTGPNDIFQIHCDSGGNPLSNAVIVWCPNFGFENAGTISAGGTLAINDSSGNGLALNGSGLVTFYKMPAITSGYFAGATVARATGSGDTTGTVTIANTTPQSITIQYSPGSTVNPNTAAILVTFASALPFTPNPVMNTLIGGVNGGNVSIPQSVSSASFKIAPSNGFGFSPGSTYTITVFVG